MLLKIICIAVLVVLPRVFGYENGDEIQQEYRGEDSHDIFGSYQQDNDEDADSVRVKRFEGKQTVKTLSPQELQEVRGAIKQILSGYNQENPFTPLPVQASNAERSTPDYRVNHKPRRAPPSHQNYPFDVLTKFNDYTDVIDNTKFEASTLAVNEPLTTNEQFQTSTLTTNENYDVVSNNDLIQGTINSLSSLPIIPGTDDVTKFDIKGATKEEILNDNDGTVKTTDMTDYETETNIGLTGATINVSPLATLSPIESTDDTIQSEINSILGRVNDQTHVITSNKIVTKNKIQNNLVGATISALPTRSRNPANILRDDVTESLVVTSSTELEQLSEKIDSIEHADPTELENLGETVDSTQHADSAEVEDSAEKIDSTEHTASAENVHDADDLAANEQHEFENDEEEGLSTEKTKKTSKKFKNKPGNVTMRSTGPTKRTTRTRTRRTTRTTTTQFKLDVPALLAIIANLTHDYEMNLTDNLNATLLKYSIPTCETPTTTVKRGIFVDYDANATGTIVAKCFVCGLEVEKIPRNAHCADAFAGDFLPLVPVDMTARGKISKYRKYCRYADVPRYMTNSSQPRSVFGRWTGGCSVRWIDLSGVYTQRSCRNRERAILGRHFASKRMAKLEMALSNVENGCITSPMATLVPLSRGISLYARFHACVCTGSWCNAADFLIPWTAGALIPMLVVFISPHLFLTKGSDYQMRVNPL